MRYFKIEEFNCPCCDKQNMDSDFLLRLDEARRNSGVKFVITSGYRCENYQKALKKRGYETAHGVSPHQKGVACDISAKNDKDRYAIISALMYVGFGRIGVGSNFVHVDMDLDRNPDRIWHYKR